MAGGVAASQRWEQRAASARSGPMLAHGLLRLVDHQPRERSPPKRARSVRGDEERQAACSVQMSTQQSSPAAAAAAAAAAVLEIPDD